MQFGRALHRILRMILEAHPRFGPVYISKVDIVNRLYRIWLLPNDIPTLGVSLPTTVDKEPMIVFPLALPMGWVNSPPYFAAATETIMDLDNAALATDTKFPTHRLDAISETDPVSVADYQDPPPPPSRTPSVSTTVPEDRVHECTSTTSGPLPRMIFTSTIVCRWSKAVIAASSKSSAPSFTPWILSSVALTRRTAPTIKSPPRSRNCSRVMAPGPQPNLSSAGSSIPSTRRPSCRFAVWRACRKSSRICLALSSASPPASGNKFLVSYAPCCWASQAPGGSLALCNTRCAFWKQDAFG
jgi:hypothetical protein